MTMTEWRYLDHGHVLHALADARRPWSKAVCGAHPDDFGAWFGHRNQDEHEKAALLPKCKRCVARGRER